MDQKLSLGLGFLKGIIEGLTHGLKLLASGPMGKGYFYTVIAFLLSISSLEAQTSESLADFKVRLTWRKSPDPAPLEKSDLYRSYHSSRIIAYICDHKNLETLKTSLIRTNVKLLGRGEDSTTVPDLAGCIHLGVKFDLRFDAKAKGAPSSYYQVPYPVKVRTRNGDVVEEPVFMEFSAVDFYRKAIHELKISDIGEATLVLTYWRVGTNLVHNPVMEFLDLQPLDFLKATLVQEPAYELVLDSATTLGSERSSKVSIEASFEMIPIPDSSPYYDLNVPNELFRPSIVRLMRAKSKEAPISLEDFLKISNVYYLFQDEKTVWGLLREKLSRSDFKSQAVTDFLAKDQVKRVLDLNANEALNVYLYYYRANLEDVDMRLTSVQERERNDPRNYVMVDGSSRLSTESQEALARYELNQRRIRDTIILLDLVGRAGRNYLDEILR